jgi:hypothetical protein
MWSLALCLFKGGREHPVVSPPNRREAVSHRHNREIQSLDLRLVNRTYTLPGPKLRPLLAAGETGTTCQRLIKLRSL